MRNTIGLVGIMLMTSSYAVTLYADPPHRGGLPPGLQKKSDRGYKLPPGWRNKSSVYEYDYTEPFDERYEPDYLEDKVIRIIKDVRDLTGPVD